MKGIILAGGLGTRLLPTTKVTNKHLLPIYNKPMIYYPIETLRNAGIKQILIVSGPEHAGHFLSLLGSGRTFGVNFSYEIQEEPGGIAQALGICEDFADNDSVVVILGDNIFDENITPFVNEFKESSHYAKVFLKEHPNPKRFGVAEIKGDKIINIEEKPENPATNLVVTGLYMYPPNVFDIIRTLNRSDRGEYEITDVNNYYIHANKMKYKIIGGFWSDAGSHESLFTSAQYMRNKKIKSE